MITNKEKKKYDPLTEKLVEMLEKAGAKVVDVTPKRIEEKEEIKKTIIKELEKLKDSVRLVVCDKTYDKYKLIEGVKKENEIGKFMIKLKENYIKYYEKKK